MRIDLYASIYGRSFFLSLNLSFFLSFYLFFFLSFFLLSQFELNLLNKKWDDSKNSKKKKNYAQIRFKIKFKKSVMFQSDPNLSFINDLNWSKTDLQPYLTLKFYHWILNRILFINDVYLPILT